MNEGQLFIDGKSFISSTRAAQLVGYTKDYIGQLARAGKIESKLIGRSWYVSEDAVQKHKLAVHYTLTKPKKPRLVEQKPEIHASEKTIHSIDNSSQTGSVSKQPLSYAEIGTDVSVKQFERDSVDLYPVVSKKNFNNALLHSDIYFESDTPPEVDAGTRPNIQDTATFQSTPLQSATSVPIRTKPRIVRNIPSQRHIGLPIRENKSQHTNQREMRPRTQTAIDGIVPSATYQKRDVRSHFNAVTHNEYEEQRSLQTKRRERGYEEEYRSGRSRLIPIAGAVIIFLILAVAYLIF